MSEINSKGFPVERTPKGFKRSGYPNERCGYYPCHHEGQSCLFCYCPLYDIEDCPGTPKYVEVEGRKIKDCSDCGWRYDPANEDEVNEILRRKLGVKSIRRN